MVNFTLREVVRKATSLTFAPPPLGAPSLANVNDALKKFHDVVLFCPKDGPRLPGRTVRLFSSNIQPYSSEKNALATLPSFASTLRRLEVMPKMLAACLAWMYFVLKRMIKVMHLLYICYYERGGIVIFRA